MKIAVPYSRVRGDSERMTFAIGVVVLVCLFVNTSQSQYHNNPYNPCTVCDDSECVPRVCSFAGGECDHSCVDCRDDSECRWTSQISLTEEPPQSRPYCFNNECVECLDDSYCGKDKPYCSDFRKCEPCLQNIHCRNETQCDGVCELGETGNVCKPMNGRTEFLECGNGDICYKWLGECHKECHKVTTIETTWTSPLPTEIPFAPINCPPSNSSLTKNSQCGDDGICYECITNYDCNTNQTCGSLCQYDDNHYYCTTNTKACSSSEKCTLNQTSKQFFCSSSAHNLILNLSNALIYLVVVFVLSH